MPRTSTTHKKNSHNKVKILRDMNSTRPLLWAFECNGKEYVVKDYSFHRKWYRELIGKFLIYREAKALRRLRKTEGVPELVCWPTPYRIVTTRVNGITLEECGRNGRVEPEFFVRLKGLIDTLHSKGIAHCDLKRAANIMVTEAGKPYIIDFSAAIFDMEFPLFLKAIYSRFKKDDEAAITKYRMRFCPKEVTDLERSLYLKKGNFERLIRSARDKLRKLVKEMAEKG